VAAAVAGAAAAHAFAPPASHLAPACTQLAQCKSSKNCQQFASMQIIRKRWLTQASLCLHIRNPLAQYT
jgi:hypothetical protein